MSLEALSIAFEMTAPPGGALLTPLAKLVLIYLADQWGASADGLSSDNLGYSVEKIAAFACVDPDTAIGVIESLEQTGAIWAIRRELTESEISSKEAIAERDKNRYQKRSVPAKLKMMVHRRDNFVCVICKRTEDLSIDHIVPEVEGGTDSIENLQTLCRSCNSKKGRKRVTFADLQGIAKEAFEQLGGGEAFLLAEREAFNKSMDEREKRIERIRRGEPDKLPAESATNRES